MSSYHALRPKFRSRTLRVHASRITQPIEDGRALVELSSRSRIIGHGGRKRSRENAHTQHRPKQHTLLNTQDTYPPDTLRGLDEKGAAASSKTKDRRC
jgi:hypothetical protein